MRKAIHQAKPMQAESKQPKAKLQCKPQGKKLPLPPPLPINHPLMPTRGNPFADQEGELERLARRSTLAQGLRAAVDHPLVWAAATVLIALALGWSLLGRFGLDPTSRNAGTDASRQGPAFAFDSLNWRSLKRGSADPADRLSDDLALIVSLETDPQTLRSALQSASVDAMQIQTDPTPVGPLRDLNEIKSKIELHAGESPNQNRMSFDGRDPRLRSQMVRSQGGSTITEAAVAKGVRWLASVQNQDGGWSLKGYASHDRPDNPSDAMATSLATITDAGGGANASVWALQRNCKSRAKVVG